jgi:orotidine-5'-phosphate decarboxylase
MPRSIFLIPGVGAQGGRPEELGAAFAPGPAAGLVAASRSIAGDPDPAAAADRLRAAVWEVSGA